MGTKTIAAERRIVTMSGPSILGAEVRTMKQKATQARVMNTIWVRFSFLRIVSLLIDETKIRRNIVILYVIIR